MAAELGPRRIAVNTIAPGVIETGLGGGAVRDNPEPNKIIASDTALGRVGLPETGRVNAQRVEASGGVHPNVCPGRIQSARNR